MQKLPYVLLVDDDTTTNFLNQRLLAKLAVADEVLMARDGRQALALLAARPATAHPGLVLLDVNMPGMNGLEFLEHYQQLPPAARQAQRVVMLTTSLHPRDVQRVQALGLVASFLTKPLTADKLHAVLAAHFG